MATTQAADRLLDPRDMAVLRRLDLVHNRVSKGLYPGQRRSSRSARSVEFADFRPYAPGDDLRQIDWRAFGRLEKLMVRLSVAEEEAACNVVVDTSASMALGTPSKWPVARRLGAALAMMGLTAMDRVAVGALDRSMRHTPHVRRSGGSSQLLGFLRGLEPAGTGRSQDLAKLPWLRPGLTVVISDFLGEDDWAAAMLTVGQAGQDLLLWQVLSPDEERPEVRGDLRLMDVESGRSREITVTPRVIHDYLRALAEYRLDLARRATAAGGRFVHTRSDEDLETSMLAALRAGAIRRV